MSRAFAGLAAASLAACGGADEPPVRVFAAASLAAPFGALVAAFERAHPGPPLDLHCAGTATLVVQLREGAPADVLAAADAESMARVVGQGRVVGGSATFATNRLAIAVAPGNPLGVTGLTDLARDDLRVVLCAPDVPAGRYAREALGRAGLAVRSRSDEPSVAAVVAKVRLGEVDAGVVYATDVAAARGAVDGLAIPDATNVVATYPIAALDAGGRPERGAEFAAFVRSDAGAAILREHGFGAP